jgi:uncharacterized cupin superfamily protein
MQQALPGTQPAAVFNRDDKASLACFRRQPGHMRRDDDTGEIEEWVGGVCRFTDENVESGRGDAPRFEPVYEGGLV